MEMMEKEPAEGWWQSETNGWELGRERLFPIAALRFYTRMEGQYSQLIVTRKWYISRSESQRRDSQFIVTRKLYLPLKAKV